MGFVGRTLINAIAIVVAAALIPGLSGAGKSQGAKVFEDLGYYILDNLPPALMSSALDVARKGGHPRVAMVVDARSGALFTDAAAELERLDRAGTRPHVLFFDASDDVLLRRYSEEKKARLGIAFGCTGGRHRSVAIADEVAQLLRASWTGEVVVQHRDRDRPDVRT